MSNKIINLKKDNECLNKEKEVNDWLRKDLIYKYNFVDKSINFFWRISKKMVVIRIIQIIYLIYYVNMILYFMTIFMQ